MLAPAVSHVHCVQQVLIKFNNLVKINTYQLYMPIALCVLHARIFCSSGFDSNYFRKMPENAVAIFTARHVVSTLLRIYTYLFDCTTIMGSIPIRFF